MTRLRWGERVYRALLALHPRSFRRAYGDDLLAAFSARYRDPHWSRARLWTFHLNDLLRSIFREHVSVMFSRSRDGNAVQRGGAATLGGHMGTMMQDIRYALRSFRRNPGFAAIVILTLGLGIGMNTAIFSVVDGVLLTPLPFDDADRLVWGYSTFSGGNNASVSPPDFWDYRDQSTAFAALSARRGGGSYALTGMDKPEQVRGQTITAGFFEALGAAPVLGRMFLMEDESSATSKIVVISYGFWQRRFGGEASVLGRTLTLNDEPFEIVGVAPPGFQLFNAVDFWRPLAFDVGDALVRRFHNLKVVGRLAPGVSMEQAQAELDVISKRLEDAYPQSNATWRMVIVPLHQIAVGDVRPALLVLLAAVGLVLLIGCVNVANLLLARGAARESEMAVRTALGASSQRLMRQLLTESFMLAVLGGVLGTVLAVVSVRALRASALDGLPGIFEVAVDYRVLAFALGLSVITGAVFGLLPSIAGAKTDVNAALKEGGRSGNAHGNTTRAALVTIEVALSMVLLIGAGLLIQSFWRLNNVDPGFDIDNALTFRISLPSTRYDTREKQTAFMQLAAERIRGVPGVVDVAVTSHLPLAGSANDTYLAVPGRHQLGTDTQFNAQTRSVSTNFFELMGIPLIRGRQFTEADRVDSPNVVIINEPFAARIFPDEDPVGQRLLIDLGETHDAEIVGVVGGVNHFGLGAQRPVEFYVPITQLSFGRAFVVRTSLDPMTLTDEVQAAVWTIDDQQPVTSLATYEDLVTRSMSQPFLQMMLLGFFALVALVLAALGIYGVIGYYVAQRVREVGIRMALGADRRDVYRLVVGRGAMLAGAGIVVGLVSAFGVTRFMASLLFGVGATDPATFVIVPVVLGMVALLASYLPARRAAGVDPMTALRSEQ